MVNKQPATEQIKPPVKPPVEPDASEPSTEPIGVVCVDVPFNENHSAELRGVE